MASSASFLTFLSGGLVPLPFFSNSFSIMNNIPEHFYIFDLCADGYADLDLDRIAANDVDYIEDHCESQSEGVYLVESLNALISNSDHWHLHSERLGDLAAVAGAEYFEFVGDRGHYGYPGIQAIIEGSEHGCGVYSLADVPKEKTTGIFVVDSNGGFYDILHSTLDHHQRSAPTTGEVAIYALGHGEDGFRWCFDPGSAEVRVYHHGEDPASGLLTILPALLATNDHDFHPDCFDGNDLETFIEYVELLDNEGFEEYDRDSIISAMVELRWFPGLKEADKRSESERLAA